MESKSFKGKAIYNPSGKAKEYSLWACNFYVGCSNGCTYCYLKKGRGKKHLGGNEPKLKACFKDEHDAIKIFMKELRQNINEIRKYGLFFSFTTDPMIEKTKDLTLRALYICNGLKVPVKILTKEVGYLYQINKYCDFNLDKKLIAIGITLTGDDRLEPNASNNQQRINALGVCKVTGFKTFASIEPIISFKKAKLMIIYSINYVDLYKIGLESGKKYDIVEAQNFVEWLDELQQPKIYLKESLQKLSRYKNSELDSYFVDRDYNIFN